MLQLVAMAASAGPDVLLWTKQMLFALPCCVTILGWVRVCVHAFACVYMHGSMLILCVWAASHTSHLPIKESKKQDE